MLAKELKIKTLKKQREYIEKKLRQAAKSNDGDLSYIYVGYLHPEVENYFKEEGYDVDRVLSERLKVAFKGRPVYLFTPQARIELTDEEKKRRKNIITERINLSASKAPS